MKKVLLYLLLFIATTTNAQTLLKGDMNKDGKITLTDLTSLINVANGNTPVEAINVYEVNNSTVIGTWYASDGTSLIFREDGTTNYPGGDTYEFMPILGRLLVYDTIGTVVKTMTFKKVTPEYLLEESAINGALTYYTNSEYVVTEITLNRNSLSLNSGGTFPLQATALPLTALNSSMTWTSSDENVATVNANGLVTAVGGGTCTITCTAKDGGGASATCEVTVVQLVTDITLSQTTLVLLVDGYKRLTATVLPSNASNQGVTWASSDESIAEVTSNGLVAAVALGTCTITCTAKDGSGVKATCEVIVDLHECVDLGLPSGTQWATCNIGSNSPEDYGDYFAWGETTGYNDGKTDFSWSTYKYCKGSENTLTKYCDNNSYGYNGFTDTLTKLLPEDDAATTNWGVNWCMPSLIQYDELTNSEYTTLLWTTQNGVSGELITSKSNGNSIFIPAAGCRYNTSLYKVGSYGGFWTLDLYPTPIYAWKPYFNSGSESSYYLGNRYSGHSIRPVRVSQ